MCCRIILNLRQAASPRGSNSAAVTTGLMFVTSPGQQIEQVETIQLEGRDTRSDEGSLRGADVDAMSTDRHYRPVGTCRYSF